MSFGTVYTAIVGSEIYVKWACFSAKTVKKYMPEVRTSLYTNRPDLVNKCKWGVFIDDILEAPDYPPVDWQGAMIDGILASEKLGYDVTFFTGADTAICDDMTEIFELMTTGNFDLALTQPRDQRKRRYPLRGVHPGFPYYNDGAQFFPWNDATRKFYRDWRDLQWTHKVECAASKKPGARMHPTQPPFNEALYHNSNLRLVLLPKNYNEQLWTGCIYGKVKVVHVHGAGARKAARMGERFNENWQKPRLFRDRKIFK